MKRRLEKIGSIYLITDTIAGFENFLSDAGFALVRVGYDDYWRICNKRSGNRLEDELGRFYRNQGRVHVTSKELEKAIKEYNKRLS